MSGHPCIGPIAGAGEVPTRAGDCNEECLATLEECGIRGYVALGREGKERVDVDSETLPAVQLPGCGRVAGRVGLRLPTVESQANGSVDDVSRQDFCDLSLWTRRAGSLKPNISPFAKTPAAKTPGVICRDSCLGR